MSRFRDRDTHPGTKERMLEEEKIWSGMVYARGQSDTGRDEMTVSGMTRLPGVFQPDPWIEIYAKINTKYALNLRGGILITVTIRVIIKMENYILSDRLVGKWRIDRDDVFALCGAYEKGLRQRLPGKLSRFLKVIGGVEGNLDTGYGCRSSYRRRHWRYRCKPVAECATCRKA